LPGDVCSLAQQANQAWEALLRIVSADDREWLGFLTAFEWSVESDAPARLPSALQQDLIASGLATANDAKQVTSVSSSARDMKCFGGWRHYSSS